jgi:hypothetical protein
MASVNAEQLRDGWTRAQVGLLLLAAAAVAGSAGQGEPAVALLLAGTLALAVACLHRLVPLAAVSAPTGARLRAWTVQEAMIWRAEEPDRPGRVPPRAPGAGRSAP